MHLLLQRTFFYKLLDYSCLTMFCYFLISVKWICYMSRLWFFQWSCMDVRVGLWRRLNAEELMLLNCDVEEDSWDSLGLQGDPTSPFWRRSTAQGQREEFRPWQRSWGRRLGICKGVIKPQENPCSQASTPKPESVLCSHLHRWLYGGLSPITVSLGGVNMQL